MRILVAGTGAVACVYAAHLADPGGHEVVVFGNWKEQLDVLGTAGITINGKNGSTRIPVKVCAASERLEGPFDLVIVATKSYQLAQRVAQIRHVIGRETAIFGIQNGLTPWKVLTDALMGAGIAMAGETMVAARKVGMGVVDVHFLGETVLAAVDSRNAGTAELSAEIVRSSGMSARTLATDQLTELLWQKAILACGLSALSIILRVPVSAIHASPAAARVALGAMAEVQRVAAALGVTLDATSSFAASAAFGANRPSTLEDYLAGRPSEVPDLNGAVVEHAKACGIQAPVNAILNDLVAALYESVGERIP